MLRVVEAGHAFPAFPHFAYDLRGHQLTGGPSWLDHDRYDVIAKPAQNDNPSGARRSFEEEWRAIRMSLRAVLADRFQLAIDTIRRVPRIKGLADAAIELFEQELAKHREYVPLHGEDLPEVRNWRWEWD